MGSTPTFPRQPFIHASLRNSHDRYQITWCQANSVPRAVHVPQENRKMLQNRRISELLAHEMPKNTEFLRRALKNFKLY